MNLILFFIGFTILHTTQSHAGCQSSFEHFSDKSIRHYFNSYGSPNAFSALQKTNPYFPRISDIQQIDWSRDKLIRIAKRQELASIQTTTPNQYQNIDQIIKIPLNALLTSPILNSTYRLATRDYLFAKKIKFVAQNREKDHLTIIVVGARHALDFYLQNPNTNTVFLSPIVDQNTLLHGRRYPELLSLLNLDNTDFPRTLASNSKSVFASILRALLEQRLISSTKPELKGPNEIFDMLNQNKSVIDTRPNLLVFMDLHGISDTEVIDNFPSGEYWRDLGYKGIDLYLEGIPSHPASFGRAFDFDYKTALREVSTIEIHRSLYEFFEGLLELKQDVDNHVPGAERHLSNIRKMLPQAKIDNLIALLEDVQAFYLPIQRSLLQRLKSYEPILSLNIFSMEQEL